MLKPLVISGFFFLFSAFIWSFGLRPQNNEALLNYLVFSLQLLYGSACYDVMKSLREIPQDHKFWRSSLWVAGEAAGCLLVSFLTFFLAFRVNVFAYTGLVVALVCYGYIFVKVLPKLHPLYKEAQSNAKQTSAIN